jgi:cold shock CspA family protein
MKYSGKVCFFSPKGFGYIRPDDPNVADIYVHHSGLLLRQREMVGGLAVEFDRSERNGKPIAVNVDRPNRQSRRLIGGAAWAQLQEYLARFGYTMANAPETKDIFTELPARFTATWNITLSDTAGLSSRPFQILLGIRNGGRTRITSRFPSDSVNESCERFVISEYFNRVACDAFTVESIAAGNF